MGLTWPNETICILDSTTNSQPSTPRARSSPRSNDSTSSKCSDCRRRCENKDNCDAENQGDFDDDSGILNEIMNEGEGSGSESNEAVMRHSDSLSSGSDSGYYNARGIPIFIFYNNLKKILIENYRLTVLGALRII